MRVSVMDQVSVLEEAKVKMSGVYQVSLFVRES